MPGFSAALSPRPTYLLISPTDRDQADTELICVFQPDGMVGIAMMSSIGEASGGVRAVGRGRKLPPSAPIAVVVHRASDPAPARRSRGMLHQCSCNRGRTTRLNSVGSGTSCWTGSAAG